MSAAIEYKGDDVDQAISNACDALGVAREALDIQVVTPGFAGIFGLGRKKAVVRVSLRESLSGRPATAAAATTAKGSVDVRATGGRRSGAVAPGGSKPAAADLTSPEAEPERSGQPRSEGGSRREQRNEPVVPLSAEELSRAKITVDRMLELTGCAVSAELAWDEAACKLRGTLQGADDERLVGEEGQTLDALQYLLRKTLSKQVGRRVNLELDAAGYRERRHRELAERALALAAEVKSSGKSRTMPAMGPAERRIVHLALQADGEIRSRSVGDGLFKKVLIHPPGKGRKRPPRSRSHNR